MIDFNRKPFKNLKRQFPRAHGSSGKNYLNVPEYREKVFLFHCSFRAKLVRDHVFWFYKFLFIKVFYLATMTTIFLLCNETTNKTG